ncbi:Fe2+-dependent dioxygenase [Jidongwangia harbinensis]|uniref:Fe2+-dependent dioxygenase n=1 Tax=Jidongwangia harbinensis TaxID=2878561 RepID=UPI001CD93C24|nr:Fe2+-dependent dioxygenase [Jidongwangia harbinensis]MCA2219343.1 Fe2+-dependent dioxygenase [Jidongwangia harbinensis]
MWPSIITIENFLSKTELETVLESTDTARFVDGGVTAGGGNLSVKNNREMAAEQEYVDVVKIVERALRANVELNYTVFPRSITRAIVSRYDQGMSYGVHIDSPVIGFMSPGQAGSFGQNYLRSDFSMTVFLSEPDSYAGGDLSFGSPWGTQTYKLSPGSAVVYPTGLPHEVTPITAGTRLAVVLWLQSMVRDHEQRRLVSDINRLASRLIERDPESAEASLARDTAANALRLAADV